MIEAIAFQTRARTIDHLGREQIADCPTAVSELWKNAFDAYASQVSLHIFDDSAPVAVMLDDGHGMSKEEFVSKWLVVGTESKITDSSPSAADRNGLPYRQKQGQKGIGRLSCANLGPLLLLISKRSDHDFVAALVDWRFFENPYLNLSDVRVPVITFQRSEELFPQLPGLFDQLMENLWGGPDPSHAARIRAAWTAYDTLYAAEKEAATTTKSKKPSEEIAETIIDAAFSDKHLQAWSVWNGQSDRGTALLVSQINFDLRAQVIPENAAPLYQQARERLFETLSNFVNPFVNPTKMDGQPKNSPLFIRGGALDRG